MRYEIFKLGVPFVPAPDGLAGYEYGVEFRQAGGGGMVAFHDVRNWLCDIYGWSDQLYNRVTNTDNEYWTWAVRHDSYKIYLRGDSEVMMFKLRFSVVDCVE